jgi:hypothetical protein
MAQAGQFTVHPAVSPRRVLRCQPQHQFTDLPGRPRPARPTRVRPLAGDETAVPGQQRSGRDQPAATQRGGQQPGQRCHDRAVGPVRPGAGDMAAEHHHLVTQHYDLRVLRCLAAAQQDQPTEQPDCDQIQQTDRDEPRSCRKPPTRPNRRSHAKRTVLKRHGPRSRRPQPQRCRWPIRFNLIYEVDSGTIVEVRCVGPVSDGDAVRAPVQLAPGNRG